MTERLHRRSVTITETHQAFLSENEQINLSGLVRAQLDELMENEQAFHNSN